MIWFLKMKYSFWNFPKKIKKNWDAYSRFFLSNEASSAVWGLPKNSEKIFYAHSVSRHLFDLYDDYLQKVPFFLRPAYRIMAWILRKIYIAEMQKFDVILTNSPTNQARLQNWCGVHAEVLYPPVNTEKFLPKWSEKWENKNSYKIFQKYTNSENFLEKIWENDAGFFISFSRVNTTKWVHKIIETFKNFPEKNLLIIFGTEDSDREKFQKFSEILPSKEQNKILLSEKFPNIFWLSLSENDDLWSIIAEAKATICMSKNEDFWMVAIESMATGVPVLAPNEGGYTLTIINGKTGILFPDNSARSLSHALNNTPENFYQNSFSACIDQASVFSLDNFEKKLLNFL